MKEFKTERGTVLPLFQVERRSKDKKTGQWKEMPPQPYLQVAYRLQWLNEREIEFRIDTEHLLLTDEQTITKAHVAIFKDGVLIRSATATKRETRADFPDHTEKSETSAVGRALAMIGFGTQFAIADFDEGERLADSPLPIKTPLPMPLAASPVNHLGKAVDDLDAEMRSLGELPGAFSCDVCQTPLRFSEKKSCWYCPNFKDGENHSVIRTP